MTRRIPVTRSRSNGLPIAVARQNVTDRALRYRANQTICAMCGATDQIEIDHVDGFEEHGEGRLTRQYNPGGARSLQQWAAAVTSLHGHGEMSLPDAVALVHATPAADRSRFAKQIWSLRRRHGTDKTGTPF
jgi:hypothetical protein